MTDKVTKRSIIAARLREARKMAGLSQGQVATKLNLHRPSVSEIESGNRSVAAEELTILAKLYDVSIFWLSGETSDTLNIQDIKVELAARELRKLKPEELDRLLRLLAATESDKD